MLSSTKLRSEILQYLENSLCNDQAKQRLGFNECYMKYSQLLKSLGQPPMFTTLRVNTRETKIHLIIEELQTMLAEQYRTRQSNEHCPEIFLHPEISDCVVIRNEGPRACILSDKEVIVDASCGMAVLRGADIYVQGILAAPPGMVEGDKVSVFVDLNGLCRKGLTKPFDGEKLFVGNGIAKISRQEVFCSQEKLSGVGVSMSEPLYSAPSLSEFAAHLVFPQNLPSIVCVHVLDPRPGETVLDMCAAPGGKTTHIATLMQNQGRVVALDKNKNKIEKIRQNATRWHLNCIDIYSFSGTRAVHDQADLAGSPPYPPSSFDKVLLDAPCSALGQRPSLRNDISFTEIQSYSSLQKHLFEKAVALLKEGGTLVYSTCTITLQENESIVYWALQTFPNLTLDKQHPCLGGPGWPGSGLTAEQETLLQRFDPSVTLDECQTNDVNIDTIGFFIAKFVKQS